MTEFLELDEEDIKQIIPRITRKGVFGENGRVLIIGGDKGFSLPVAVAANTATLSGIDSLYIMIPEKLSKVLACKVKWGSIITLPDLKLTYGVAKKILRLIERRKIVVDTVLLGPGLKAINKDLVYLTQELVNKNMQIMIDEGAIYNEVIDVVKDSAALVSLKMGELNRIIEYKEVSELPSLLNEFTRKVNFTFLIKDYDKFIVSSKGHSTIIRNKKRVPVKYGLFHILSGLTVGLFSLFKDPETASRLASFFLLKTCENLLANYGLHYTIENVIENLQDTLSIYLKGYELS